MLKKCSDCKQEITIEQFSRNKSTKDGFSYVCKVCSSKRFKDYKNRNRDLVSEKNKKYKIQNKEKIKTQVQQYYLAHKDAIDTYNRTYWKQEQNKIRRNASRRILSQELKTEVFSHYSDGEPRCKNCGLDDLYVLTIDHIDGNGNKHRKESGMGRGHKAYGWLKRNNYPNGFQVLCFNCQLRKRNIEKRPKYPSQKQMHDYEWVRSIKMECLEKYGGCKCPCGEKNLDALTLHHDNNDGAKHRKNIGAGGLNFYLYLRRNSFPNDPPLQVLCMNCNFKKRNTTKTVEN